MVPQDKIIEIFCSVDDFCNGFETEFKTHQLSDGKRKRNRAFTMSESEVITIAIMFYLGGFRDFKHFYLGYVCKHLQADFPRTVSYSRFVELMQRALLPMVLYLKTRRMANCTGFLSLTLHRSVSAIIGVSITTKYFPESLNEGTVTLVGSLASNFIV